MAHITSVKKWVTDTPVPCVMDSIAYGVFKQYDGALVEDDYYTIDGVVMLNAAGKYERIEITCTGIGQLRQWMSYLERCGYDAKTQIDNYESAVSGHPKAGASKANTVEPKGEVGGGGR